MEKIKERIFFLPNHTLQWLRNVIKYSNLQGKRILIVGGLLYSAYFPREFEVTVIEKNKLALLSQLYILWLKSQNFLYEKIRKILFLDKFGNRLQIHKRVRYITLQEYYDSFSLYQTFLKDMPPCLKNLKGGDLEKDFRKIFQIFREGEKLVIYLIPKGLNSYEFLKIPPLRRFNEINCFNIPFEKFQSIHKFDLIISTNVIENFENPFNFFEKSYWLLKKQGKVEITTYNNAFASWIKYVKLLANITEEKTLFLGNAYLFQKKGKGIGKEYLFKLKLNENTFLFPKQELYKVLKLISIQKFLPSWLKDIEKMFKVPKIKRCLKKK